MSLVLHVLHRLNLSLNSSHSFVKLDDDLTVCLEFLNNLSQLVNC
jgi:hypothetical protein